MVVTFDSSNFQRVDDATWVHPPSGDRITLRYETSRLGEPVWLEDVPAMRRNLANEYAKAGCLIEAEPVVLGGVPGVCQVVKVPIPNAPSGQVFMANIFLAKADRYVMFGCASAESGTTGVREATIMAKLGLFTEGWFLPHPYAPELEGALPFHRGDDPVFDAQFPDHPLSRVRAWVRWVLGTATVDPAFAQMPDFVPSGPGADHTP